MESKTQNNRKSSTTFSEYAQQDKVLVRLKGGDPYVFGRGAEEYCFLKQHGFDVVVIPGVSSAVGVPTVAGIPVTAREVSSAFAVVAGHCSKNGRPDWSRYAHIDTLVILMGIKERASIAACLIEAGREPNEPVAFVENGSCPNQRIIRSTLEEVRDGLTEVSSPAVLVIGKVTRFLDHPPDNVLSDTPAETLNVLPRAVKQLAVQKV